jgi:hypothetical protein
VPVWTPSMETSPARGPWLALRVVMYRTAGPGMINRPSAVSAKSGSVASVGTR